MNTSIPSSNILCNHCNTHFYKKPAEINRSSTHFCSRYCAVEYRKSLKYLYYTEVECLNCTTKFNKKNSEITKSPNHFCSRSCSAKVNNKITPKRMVEGNCKECCTPIPSALIYCKECSSKVLAPIKGRFYYDDKTLEEATREGKKASRYCTIREYARKTLSKSGIERCCQNCGYDKHVEVCHIKSISSFDLSTTIREINDLSNLIYLCPNCHWELDKGILKLNGR
jgi:predicted HNH restriction endonuclease